MTYPIKEYDEGEEQSVVDDDGDRITRTKEDGKWVYDVTKDEESD